MRVPYGLGPVSAAQSNRLETLSSLAISSDRLADQRRDRNHPDIVGNPDRFGCLDGVGENQFLEPRGGDLRHRSAGKNPVRDIGIDHLGAVPQHGIGGVA